MRRQEAFFLEADRPLKPMTLKEIADALSIHESTVSRAVNGKYLETTFGVFELRSFFSTSILSSEEDGEDVSTTMVKKQLQKLIDQEVKVNRYLIKISRAIKRFRHGNIPANGSKIS